MTANGCKTMTFLEKKKKKNCTQNLTMIYISDVNKTYLNLQLFIQGIVYPQVDIPSPMSLLLYWRDVCYSSLVHFPDRVWVCITLHQTQVIEPGIIIVGICLNKVRGLKGVRTEGKPQLNARKSHPAPISLLTLTSSSYWKRLLLTMTSSIPLRSPNFFSKIV